MQQGWVRLATGSAFVCVASWVALLSAGGVGLQRSISKGAVTLFEQPLANALVAAAAFGVAFVCTRRLRLQPLRLVAGVLLGNLFAGLVLAPIAIGELEPIHAPLVFAAVSVAGIQPLAAFLGAAAAARRTRSSGDTA